MEGCLKKLVLKAEAMGFGDPWKGGWEPMGASGRKTVPEGLDWKQSGVYSQPPGAKKLIPVQWLTGGCVETLCTRGTESPGRLSFHKTYAF